MAEFSFFSATQLPEARPEPWVSAGPQSRKKKKIKDEFYAEMWAESMWLKRNTGRRNLPPTPQPFQVVFIGPKLCNTKTGSVPLQPQPQPRG